MSYFPRNRSPLAPPKAKKPLRSVGKVFRTVRLTGVEMTQLRVDAYHGANGMCQLKLEGCMGYTPWKSGELAHKKSRGSGGDDQKSNVRWSCSQCHRKSHAYGPSGKKPCPKKERL